MPRSTEILAESIGRGCFRPFKFHTILTEKSYSFLELSDLLGVLSGWTTQHWIQHSWPRKWNFLSIIQEFLKQRKVEGGTKPKTCSCNRIMIHLHFHESCIPIKPHQFSINPRQTCILEHPPGSQVPRLEPHLLNTGPQSTFSTFSSVIHSTNKLQCNRWVSHTHHISETKSIISG